MVIIAAGDELADAPAESVVCHDVRNPAQRNDVLVRKGSPLTRIDIGPLFERGITELHVVVAEPGDEGEDAAAQRLAAAVAGPSVTVGVGHFGQVSFTSAARGMVRIDAVRLEQVNAHDDVLLLTADPDRPVDVGDTLGVIKCAPLFLPERTLEDIDALATNSGPVLQVDPFRALRVGLVAPRERLRGDAFDRARGALGQALDWYGSSLATATAVEARVEAMATGYRDLRTAGMDLILAAGAASTDPYDVVFEGLRCAGGQVTQIGIPAEPGTACWIGELELIPVLGLASCELFGQPGALDLLLPRLFAGETLDRGLLRRVALGGLLLGPSRIAPYHARNGKND